MRIRSCVNAPLKKNVVVGDGEGGAEGFDLVGCVFNTRFDADDDIVIRQVLWFCRIFISKSAILR